MKRTSKGTNRSVFQPTFGNRPDQYIGRDGVIEQFMAGLQEPVGSRNRCTLFLGQRGMGKTALLLELSDRAALASRGFPYLMQLIGYYLIQYTKEGDTVDSAIMDKSEKAAMGDMEDNVFKPILSPLSDNDKIFLKAMARQGGVVSIANLQAALGKKGPAIQPYRKRLLEAGVIEAPRRGELVFAVPYLADYLINQ